MKRFHVHLSAVMFFVLSCFVFLPEIYSQTQLADTSTQNTVQKAPLSYSLTQAMKQIDGVLSWDPFFRSGIIQSHSHNASFQITGAGRSTLVLYDNEELYVLPSPWISSTGELVFPPTFVQQLTGIFNESIQNDASRMRIAAIIIDPGHGGKDPGTSAYHTISGKKTNAVEKDIALQASKDLYSRLKAKYPDKQLIMTRAGDTFPSLEDRVTKAHSVPLKENEAIIYISIHANFSFNKDARGCEVWYLSPEYRRDVIDKNASLSSSGVKAIYNDLLEEQFTTESKLLSQLITDELVNEFDGSLPSRGIKSADWYVVKKARMPSVLVELGFVSNIDDVKLMLNSNEKFSKAIYKGITDFVESFERSGGFTELAVH
ncbi:MAG: N-acetylmuramoyl-L-alanine amidase [Spirochaetaceae bacterium]|jgi:N-acetylmuramoyl-L-alanine amidase|nr:N-acetylmuramoyl-L-alanine amidase [Spirochaetaceae bacterium]